jgi:hypothetical protein
MAMLDSGFTTKSNFARHRIDAEWLSTDADRKGNVALAHGPYPGAAARLSILRQGLALRGRFAAVAGLRFP